MTSNTSWVYTLRADTLAKLYLTRRGDLDILSLPESPSRVPYDFLVRVNGAGTLDTPEFGVTTRGIDQRLASSRWRSPLLRKFAQTRTRDAVRTTDQNLPICLFVFNIDTEDGLYLWLREPHVEQNGHTKAYLSTNLSETNGSEKAVASSAPFEHLDNAAIDRIVATAVEWYRVRDRLLRQANGFAETGIPSYGKP